MDTRLPTPAETEAVEIRLLVDAINFKYGYDFASYSEASFKRRVLKACSKHRCSNVAELLHKTLTVPDFFSLLLTDLTVTVTELFRDPSGFRAVRDLVFPYLKTFPEIKIWFAGCAGGEEVYSTAILLAEADLLDRAILYGTDINPSALKRAKDGIVDAEAVRAAAYRYQEAGGKRRLEDYYTMKYGSGLVDAQLKEHIVFSDHNLVCDGVFGEMQLIYCRNALIYFKRDLQDRAIGLFKDSLCPGGFLCLGAKETLSLSSHRTAFEEISKVERVYRKKNTA